MCPKKETSQPLWEACFSALAPFVGENKQGYHHLSDLKWR